MFRFTLQRRRQERPEQRDGRKLEPSHDWVSPFLWLPCFSGKHTSGNPPVVKDCKYILPTGVHQVQIGHRLCAQMCGNNRIKPSYNVLRSTQWPRQLLLSVQSRVEVYTRNPMRPTRPTTLTVLTENQEKEEEIMPSVRLEDLWGSLGTNNN